MTCCSCRSARRCGPCCRDASDSWAFQAEGECAVPSPGRWAASWKGQRLAALTLLVFAQVFGGAVDGAWRDNPRVPEILVECSAYLLRRGPSVKNLFRTPASKVHHTLDAIAFREIRKTKAFKRRTRVIEQIKKRVNRRHFTPAEVRAEDDPHVVAALYLDYFVQLSTPLAARQFHEQWAKAAAAKDPLDRLFRLRSIISCHTPGHRGVLEHTLRFLHELSVASGAAPAPSAESESAAEMLRRGLRPGSSDTSAILSATDRGEDEEVSDDEDADGDHLARTGSTRRARRRLAQAVWVADCGPSLHRARAASVGRRAAPGSSSSANPAASRAATSLAPSALGSALSDEAGDEAERERSERGSAKERASAAVAGGGLATPVDGDHGGEGAAEVLTAELLGFIFGEVLFRPPNEDDEEDAYSPSALAGFMVAHAPELFDVGNGAHACALLEERLVARHLRDAALDTLGGQVESLDSQHGRRYERLRHHWRRIFLRRVLEGWKHFVRRKQGKQTVYDRLRMLSTLLQAEQRGRLQAEEKLRSVSAKLRIVTFKADMLAYSEATREMLATVPSTAAGSKLEYHNAQVAERAKTAAAAAEELLSTDMSSDRLSAELHAISELTARDNIAERHIVRRSEAKETSTLRDIHVEGLLGSQQLSRVALQ